MHVIRSKIQLFNPVPVMKLVEVVRSILTADATTAEIFAALREVEEDDALRVAIITGKGERAFIAGADINELRATANATAARTMSERSHEVGLYIARMSKIVIAAINGFALGGG